ncbi:MAG: MliC family protein [Proteobacteria bacterium]|nr:MliC family protein [Pseudomonadota bacterium]
MRRYIIFGAAALALAACGDKTIATVDLACGDSKIHAKVYANYVNAVIDGKKIRLDRAVSASGARFESTGTELKGAVLWNKGQEWILIPNAKEMPITCNVNYQDCIAPDVVPTPKLP